MSLSKRSTTATSRTDVPIAVASGREFADLGTEVMRAVTNHRGTRSLLRLGCEHCHGKSPSSDGRTPCGFCDLELP